MNHSPFTITALIPLTSLTLACTNPRTTDTPTDAERALESGSLPIAFRPEPPAITAEQARVVPQRSIGNPRSWRIEAGGSRVAAELDGECNVWQLGSGDYLGPATGGEPCATWEPLETITPIASVSGVSLMHPDGQRQLVLADDRFELAGSKPIRAVARGGRRYRAAAFSPDGARLAVFVGPDQGTGQIEIWNVASARLERALEFDAGDKLIKGVWLRWNDAALVAITHGVPGACDPADDSCGWYEQGWGDSHVVQIWTTIAEDPERLELPSYAGGERIEALFLDPEQRWMIALAELQERDGTGFGFSEVPLAFELPIVETGLSWWSETLEGEPAPLDTGKVGQWSSTVGSSFVKIDEYSSEYSAGVIWSLTSLTPQAIPEAPIQFSLVGGQLLSTEGGEYAWRLGLMGRGVLLGETDRCATPWAIEEAKTEGRPPPPCELLRLLPAGCTALDANWAFDHLLVSCEDQDRWLLAPTPGPGAPVDMSKAVELGRGTGDPRQVVWGPGGLAIWTFGAGLRLFHGEQLAATHTSVIDLHRALLDEELDLALVRERGGVRVVDLVSAELGPTLAWSEPIEFAAFAPDRSQLAIAGEGELAVFLRGESQPVARWRTGKLAGIAFRQDGEVLYVGGTRPLPELALDPATGEQVEAAQLDRVAFERIAKAELDPSWRWAIEEDGTILRTIDGQALDVHASGEAAISERGWFVGPPNVLHQYRVGIGPDSPTPVYELASVADQLERPTLIADFFAGRPLPHPTLKPPP